MRILFFGSGAFSVPTLRNLEQNHQIVRVVTQPDRPGGRGRQPIATPARAMAEELGLAVLPTADVNAPETAAELLAERADLGVVLAFGQKIGPQLLHEIAGGCINAHGSLLPAYRGAAPVHWAIIRGERRTGVTVFKLVQRMDAGPILASRWTYIKPEETTSELHDRLAAIAVDAVRAALECYAADPNPAGAPQDETAATAAPKLTKEDGVLDFSRPASELASRICGLWSWPAARCLWVSAADGRRQEIALARARVAEGLPPATPAGQLDDRLHLATGDGMLEILELKPAGGTLMTWPQFVNGRRVRPGDRFESVVLDRLP